MKTKRNIALAIASILSLAAIASAPAQARNGFLSGVLKPIIGKHAADRLDDVHDAMNKPLDNPAVQGAIVSTIIPGAAPYVATAMQAREAARAAAERAREAERAAEEQAREIRAAAEQAREARAEAERARQAARKMIYTPPYVPEQQVDDNDPDDLDEDD